MKMNTEFEKLEKCPICQTNLLRKPDFRDYKILASIDCNRCGKFVITEMVFSNNLLNDLQSKSKISYWLRHHQSDNHIKLTKELLEQILSETELPKPIEQADILITYIGDNVKSPEEDLIINYNTLCAIIGATNKENVKYIAEHLTKSGLIYSILDSGNTFQGHLTFEGWQKYDELERSNKDRDRKSVV